MTLNIITRARQLLGTPYKYGAKMEEAPEVFDCSGFIKYIFSGVGIELPRSTIEQAREGSEVSIEHLAPGDLIFMHGTFGHYSPHFPVGIGHVGVYAGDDMVIHAASERISEAPILERGQVVESTVEEFLSGWAPLVVIKRMNA